MDDSDDDSDDDSYRYDSGDDIDDIGDIGSVGKKEEEETLFVGIESKTSSAFATPAPCFRLKNTPSTETYTKRNAEE